jgi:SAM-dependent methyltransferase
MKMSERGPRLLPVEELPAKVAEWQQIFKQVEKTVYEKHPERATRLETVRGGKVHEDSIEKLHGRSFLEEVIPSYIRRKHNGEKVNVLDVGAGAGLYADQIRNRWGDKVRVTTTGLSKRTAQATREQAVKGKMPVRFEKNLHPDDLKMQSILQMHDFPEFDIILDTFGEAHYTGHEGKRWQKYLAYLEAVVAKLAFSGCASIVTRYATPTEMQAVGVDGLLRAQLEFGQRMFETALDRLYKKHEAANDLIIKRAPNILFLYKKPVRETSEAVNS